MELFLGQVAQFSDRVHVMISKIQAALAALLAGHLIVGKHLLKRKLKGIADIVEKRRQSPVFQKTACGRMVCFGIGLIGIKSIKLLECCTISGIGFVDRKSQREDIYRVRVMIAVFHEQGTAVGLKLGEQFHHLLGFAVMPEEHFQIAIINGIGILRCTGTDELLKLALQAQTVDVHLHVVWNLARQKACSVIFAICLVCTEAKSLTPCMKKAKCHCLQSVIHGIIMPLRLDRADALPKRFLVIVFHLLQSCICHITFLS